MICTAESYRSDRKFTKLDGGRYCKLYHMNLLPTFSCSKLIVEQFNATSFFHLVLLNELNTM